MLKHKNCFHLQQLHICTILNNTITYPLHWYTEKHLFCCRFFGKKSGDVLYSEGMFQEIRYWSVVHIPLPHIKHVQNCLLVSKYKINQTRTVHCFLRHGGRYYHQLSDSSVSHYIFPDPLTWYEFKVTTWMVHHYRQSGMQENFCLI